MAQQTLGSKWDGLSAHLLATIAPVNAQGAPDDPKAGAPVVAPITDGTIEITANWQSAFEQSGAEQKMPFISNLLQSGNLQSYSEALFGPGNDATFIGRIAKDIEEFSKDGQGRSGMTKLNSTQVFTGAAPIKFPLTMHFRAFNNPAKEVHAAVDQLARWTLSRKLAPNGSLVSAMEAFRKGEGFLKALMPSEAPQMVSLRHGGYLFSPMVIESMSRPMTVPRTSDGEMLHVAVQLTLATLTALDQGDWTRARSGYPTQLFNN